jgi:predicted RNA-binding Zn-ribbon protein involved in translation (DUF1610 family)
MQRPGEIETLKEWEHAHVCPKCGHALRPEEIDLGSIVLGDISCPKCGWSGPINVNILEKRRSRPPHLEAYGQDKLFDFCEVS